MTLSISTLEIEFFSNFTLYRRIGKVRMTKNCSYVKVIYTVFQKRTYVYFTQEYCLFCLSRENKKNQLFGLNLNEKELFQ